MSIFLLCPSGVLFLALQIDVSDFKIYLLAPNFCLEASAVSLTFLPTGCVLMILMSLFSALVLSRWWISEDIWCSIKFCAFYLWLVSFCLKFINSCRFPHTLPCMDLSLYIIDISLISWRWLLRLIIQLDLVWMDSEHKSLG